MDSHEASAVGENVFVGDVDGAAEGTAEGANEDVGEAVGAYGWPLSQVQSTMLRHADVSLPLHASLWYAVNLYSPLELL